MDSLNQIDIKNKLSLNEPLFRNIKVYTQNFDIIPSDNQHYGVSIRYQDLQELRYDFLNDLFNSIIDWVYSSDKYKELKEIEIAKGRSEANAFMEILSRARNKFRGNHDSDNLLVQGQMGELLLFNFIQKFMQAAPLLRKMKITTSSQHERFGADAIHFKFENDKPKIILGEAKTYTSDYRFKAAFEDAVDSIINTYNNHRNELNLYVHEDFLDEEMNAVAEAYLNKTLDHPEIHLVSVVVYNENRSIDTTTTEDDIHKQIEQIIIERYQSFDNNKIDIANNPILKRIVYILFPVWELDKLAQDFQNKI